MIHCAGSERTGPRDVVPDLFGNVARYNPKLRAFPICTEDMSLARKIRIKEDVRVEFRAEALNFLKPGQIWSVNGCYATAERQLQPVALTGKFASTPCSLL
jgi:hypothetical protein